MAGPCLCGDPLCPSCGNPGAEAYDEFLDDVVEMVDNAKLNEKQAAQLKERLRDLLTEIQTS